jgi:amino acid transporter
VQVQTFKRLLLGSPIPSTLEKHERLGRATGLAVFASDALSSSAYATEEILLILVAAGAIALHTSVPIALGIALLIAIVVSSYRQTIQAYPGGGGAYIVTRENLGRYPSLVAGASLLTDYVLTVAVSVAAGIAAITSAVPPLYPYRVHLCVVGVATIAVANLRGVRESGRLFAVPTYLFVGGYALMIGWGLAAWLRGAPAEAAEATRVGPTPPGGQALNLFLILRAFSSGCVALTGIEAVSDGVPAFRPPEARHARQVLVMLGVILITLFVGITFLANAFGLTPVEGETVNSQLARHVFGTSLLYYFVQGMTTLILVLAANTSFSDFPRLASFLARDRYLPRQFASRGDRLAFSNGILILGTLSALLLVAFGGDTHALIPLYAVGVFVSFTLSQTSMVRYWIRERTPRWIGRAALNGSGAIATGVVTVIIATTKFTHGAWIVILLIPLLIAMFLSIHRHYAEVARQLSIEGVDPERPAPPHIVLVLIGDVHRGVLRALDYARALSPGARAVYVELDPDATRRLEDRWGKWGNQTPLVVLRSPYRSVVGPLLGYVDHLQQQLQQQDPNYLITIILPEFIPRRWWQHLLHNQTALLIKGALLFRRNIVVVDVPFHLEA